MYQITESVIEIPGELGQLIDVDPLDDGSYAALFQNEGKYHINFLGNIFPLTLNLAYPIIRVIDENRFLIAASRTEQKDKKDAFIFDKTGHIISNFATGDGIEDVLITKDKIVFTYFDEGIFSYDNFSTEGVTVFDFNGVYQVGYHTFFGSDAENISDCYCACHIDDNALYFYPYTEFRLVKWNLDTFQQEITLIPDNLHGATGITTDGTTFYFYSPYHEKNSLYAWHPELIDPKQIGLLPLYPRLRGLPNARFLSQGDHGYTVITIVHPEK